MQATERACTVLLQFFSPQFEQGDTVVLTYPKSGTIWMSEIVWTMKNNPDLNHPMAGLPQSARIPLLE